MYYRLVGVERPKVCPRVTDNLNPVEGPKKSEPEGVGIETVNAWKQTNDPLRKAFKAGVFIEGCPR